MATPSKEEKQRTASKKEVSGKKKSKTLQKCVTLSFQIIARRFKVFASDLEKAVHYSIAHEVSSPFFLLFISTGFLYLQVAQHSSITGETLQALQV